MSFKATISFPSGDPRKKLAALGQAVVRGHEDAVRECSILTEAQAKANATSLGAVDQGGLRASIAHRVVVTATKITGTVFIGALYGAWVEFGRRGTISSPTTSPYAAKAAFPNLTAIREWVRRHVKALAPSGRTASGRARKASTSDINSVAFLVGRKIEQHGIKPKPILLPAFRAIKRIFPARVAYWIGVRKSQIRSTP